MSAWIPMLNSCDGQVQNAMYLTKWMKPLSNRIQATATLTSCVSNHGDYLLTSGRVLDYNLLNKQYDEAG